MTRKIIPLQSVAVASSGTVYLPIAARLHHVNGECDAKPTYDFSVMVETGTTLSYSVKYCGQPNGRQVSLWTEYPMTFTTNATPVSAGFTALSVQAGANVVLQVYYALGDVTP